MKRKSYFIIAIIFFSALPFSSVFGEECIRNEQSPMDGYKHWAIIAITENKIDVLQEGIKNGFDINKGICAFGDPSYQFFLITVAAEIGNLEFLKFLIENGADIHKKSPSVEANCTMGCESYNALYFASSHPEIVAYLKSFGMETRL